MNPFGPPSFFRHPIRWIKHDRRRCLIAKLERQLELWPPWDLVDMYGRYWTQSEWELTHRSDIPYWAKGNRASRERDEGG